MVKQTSNSTAQWTIYHRGIGNTKAMYFTTAAAYTDSAWWNNTSPTASVFTLGGSDNTNNNGLTYVAYVFAGGESTAATAVSVDGFDGSRYMETDTSDSDFAFGTGDFTVEGWYKFNDDNQTEGLFSISPNGTGDLNSNSSRAIAVVYDEDQFKMYAGNVNGGSSVSSGTYKVSEQLWYHIAYVRHSGVAKLYINGQLVCQKDCTVNWSTNNKVLIGGASYNFYYLDGKISNFRVVKGTAVYTSSFRPSTEPLTNITNTKLLCCQNSTNSGTTVVPSGVALSASTSNLVVTTDSPFDDPAAFTFGENGDQNVIKCGTYSGNGSSTAGVEVNLGWEPQFIILKESDNAGNNWSMWDATRGITTGGADALLEPNSNGAEWGGANYLTVTPTGFKLESDTNNISGRKMIYIAIRRPDGSCGKPAELGTDVFNIDLDGTNSGDPSWVSGFPVDMQFIKDRAGTTFTWFLSTRLTQGKYLSTASTDAQNANSVYSHDYNNGWGNYSSANGITSWMWKRHSGMDVVAYAGNDGSGSNSQAVPHSLSKTPEMIWVKCRTSAKDWKVYHKGLNSGTSPEDKHLVLNSTAAEVDSVNIWNDTAPTSTHFTLFNNGDVNDTGKDYIAMLFASVDNISKVGNYTTNSTGAVSVTLGFQPRLVIIKRADLADTGWVIFDSARGLNTSGNSAIMQLNANYAQDSSAEQILRTATGFTVSASVTNANIKGTTSYPNGNFIYYAHA